MTELATIAISTSEHDILTKSSGSVVPATRAKLFGLDGKEVTEYDTPGELWIQSPSMTLGYLNNQKATAETYVHDEDGRWVRTGDEAIVTLAPSGIEHVVIVDRIKELIKVKGAIPRLPLNMRWDTQTDTFPQAIKSHLPNWRPIFSPTPQWPTVP